MNQFIPLPQAIDMTTLYRKEKENILGDPYKGKDILSLSETFDRENFETLLAKPDCRALRIYYGMDESLKVHAIFVAVNEKNEDIIPVSTGAGTASLTGDEVFENGVRCPPDCPPPSDLNHN